MCFIEQTDDDSSTLDTTYNRIGAIVSDEPEDGEVFESLEEYSEGDLENYGILAVSTGVTKRFHVNLHFKHAFIPFMVDTGSPTSFVDPQTAALMTGKQNFHVRPLAPSDLNERFTDFHGHPVPD